MKSNNIFQQTRFVHAAAENLIKLSELEKKVSLTGLRAMSILALYHYHFV